MEGKREAGGVSNLHGWVRLGSRVDGMSPEECDLAG